MRGSESVMRDLDCEALLLCELGVELGWISADAAQPVLDQLNSATNWQDLGGEWLMECALVDVEMLERLRARFLTETEEGRFGCRGIPLLAAPLRSRERNLAAFLGFGFFFAPEGRGFESFPAYHFSYM